MINMLSFTEDELKTITQTIVDKLFERLGLEDGKNTIEIIRDTKSNSDEPPIE